MCQKLHVVSNLRGVGDYIGACWEMLGVTHKVDNYYYLLFLLRIIF